MDTMTEICALLGQARCAVALTGAGVSTASGIPDFRSPETGLWSRVDPMEVASLRAFRRDPARFWTFYSERLASLADRQPNPAHYALARLESVGRLRGVITQNIDRLHRKAGSATVVEVHGSIDRGTCLVCGADYPMTRLVEGVRDGGIPGCDCGAPLKPGVVLFGEELPREEFERALRLVHEADLLLVVGSSLTVWPAGGLPETFLDSGGRLVVVNATPTEYDARADVIERRPAEDVLPRIAELVVSQCGSEGPHGGRAGSPARW